MSSEDQFTSIQWDRDEVENNSKPREETIIEEENVENLDNEDKDTAPDELSERTNEQQLDKPNENKDDELDEEPSNSLVLSNQSPTQETENHGEGSNESNKKVDIEESNLFDKYSIETTVTSPIRDLDSSSKPFISYLLATTTNNPSIIKLSAKKATDESSDTITIKIRRRYGDFRFLHDCLINDYPQLLIPPLPSKSNFKYLTGDTFSTEFVHKRLNSLNRFVKFILSHKILSQSSVFHLFISDSSDWVTFTKNLKINRIDNDEPSTGFVNKVVNEDLLTETVMNFLTPSKHKRETNKDILEINDKLKKLYENLIKLDKIFSKLNKKNYDLSLDYEQFSNQIIKLSAIQNSNDLDNENAPDANTAANHNSGGNDNETEDLTLSNNFRIFADSLSYFSKNWSNLHKYFDESFLVSLKDCSKYIISLTNLIELQHNKKIDLQVLQDYLNKSRNELASLGGSAHNSSTSHPPPVPVITSHNSGIVNNTTQLIKDTLSTSATSHIGSASTENKISKLQNKISQLENEIKLQTKLVGDLTSKIINEEYPNWDKFNKNELKDSMLGLCDEEIEFYKGLIDNWSNVELKLMKRLDELK